MLVQAAMKCSLQTNNYKEPYTKSREVAQINRGLVLVETFNQICECINVTDVCLNSTLKTVVTHAVMECQYGNCIARRALRVACDLATIDVGAVRNVAIFTTSTVNHRRPSCVGYIPKVDFTFSQTAGWLQSGEEGRADICRIGKTLDRVQQPYPGKCYYM